MALLGLQTIPAGAAGGNELAAVTRRAVMPGVVPQIGKSTVLLSSALAAAEPVSGGISPITVPLQGTRMVSGGWVDYSGKFAAPQVLPGLVNAEYNLAAFVVGIPQYLFEALGQLDAEIIPILWARFNDAGNYTSDQLAQALWAAQSANTNLMPFSINDIFSTTDPTQGNVGNQPSSAFSNGWQAHVATIGSINSGSSAWSRVNVLYAAMAAQKAAGGEPPSVGICDPGAWAAIAGDVIGAERYTVTHEGHYADTAEGAMIAFPAISVGGIPIYADLYASSTSTLWFPNWNYLGMKIHREAAFAVEGPESLLAQFQLGFVMALFVLLAFVTSKRNAQTAITSFTGALTL
jgi:hypothetical protein